MPKGLLLFLKVNPKGNSSGEICLIFKLVIKKGDLNQDHRSYEKVGKYGLEKVKCSPI